MRVRYRDVDGRAREGGPDQVRAVPLERCEPLREPHAYHGRPSILTRYWSATTGAMVVCGSKRLMHAAMLLDFDAAITCFSAPATEIAWEDGSAHGTVSPAFFARTADGRRLAIVHPGRAEPDGARERQALEMAAQAAGWTLTDLDVPIGVRLAWLKVVANFRFPELFDTATRPALLDAFREPRPLARGVAEAGLPDTALAHVWHLLWRGDLLFDQERPLIPVSTAWTADTAHRQAAS
ncbi:TnsA-like heteromeric transposase endonuclease subunit [Streptomyces tateyamensis]|uniref:TnsA-like heteromeric transposase endonuclease subunit n=1 Tax=Streptomyces tateyamensis TaxID=565073 RepID=UPI001FE8C41F|nr:TnsA-like heteromeric transposase endonuclease subunit [Streptomyces tateyamensis]